MWKLRRPSGSALKSCALHWPRRKYLFPRTIFGAFRRGYRNLSAACASAGQTR